VVRMGGIRRREECNPHIARSLVQHAPAGPTIALCSQLSGRTPTMHSALSASDQNRVPTLLALRCILQQRIGTGAICRLMIGGSDKVWGQRTRAGRFALLSLQRLSLGTGHGFMRAGEDRNGNEADKKARNEARMDMCRWSYPRRYTAERPASGKAFRKSSATRNRR